MSPSNQRFFVELRSIEVSHGKKKKSMLGGTIFDASQASSDDFDTSEQNPFGDECHLRSSHDPVGYSEGPPDPKHHG